MDDFLRLEAKLAKLRQRERSPGEKRLIRGTPERLLAAVTTEIDEVILPREIGFTSQSGASFHLAVANRRLQALVATSSDFEGSQNLTGVPITDASDENLVLMRNLLLDVLKEEEAWAVSSRRQTSDGFASDIGVPNEPLLRAWKIAAAALGQADPTRLLEDFMGSLGSNAKAWIRIEGEEVKDQSGPAEIVGSLGDKAAVFLDGYFSKKDLLFQGETGPSGLVFSAASDGPAIFFVDCGTSMAFILSDGAHVATLASDWQARVVL